MKPGLGPALLLDFLLAGCGRETTNLIPSATCVESAAYPGGGIYKADITDVSGMVQNGTAAPVGDALRLSIAARNSAGSVYFATPVAFDANTSVFAHFAMRISGGDGEFGADGLAFVLQSSVAGATALGVDGSGIGYQTVTPSVVVEFDTLKDVPGPAEGHVALTSNGDVANHLAYAIPPFKMNDGKVRFVWIDYDSTRTQLDVYLSESPMRPGIPLLTYAGFAFSTVLGDRVFVGLSASSGERLNDHDLLGEAWFATSNLPRCR